MQSREAMLVNPFQGGNADTEVKNRPADPVGEERMARMGAKTDVTLARV